MNYSIMVISLIIALAFVLTAGCTQTATPPLATPVPSATTSPFTTQAAPQTTLPPVTVQQVGMGTPGPTQVLPPNYMLDFMVQGNGDTVNPYMAVTLRGGNGMNFDSRVDVTFTRPDGTSQQDFMLPPFHVGQYVSFPCSPNQNRVEIWVTAPTVGKVKTYDEIVPFRNINP
jgi:hypothetical protein